MKLRILDNSIRLRLERSELRQLLQDGVVERRTVFGPAHAMVYAVRVRTQSSPLHATWRDGRLDLYVDAGSLDAWARADEASLTSRQDVGGDGELRLLLEKDFPCQHSGEHDASEKFTPATLKVDARPDLAEADAGAA